ncbi:MULTISPECIES: hypothetical protein [Agathobacter]|uniref:Uncharacterized protein n=1 Tax=Agathobacter ruminis TaxID=1712665 RepID=A0A2G3E570_9FIRM|nr:MULTISPECIES: hypothetical protein [Agathobacter]MCR5677064.1 hypothetical protein [Agathobacter sp.]MDC7302571.1 hypothetical protein [Agathobacter ruminis]PHU38295.1 hypothetical protein CSX02_03710 [Agathobacter ruminis]
MNGRKYKKNIGIIIYTIFLILVLTACQKVPDNVKNNMNRYGNNKLADKIEFQYCNLDELRNSSMENIETADSNICYPDKVDFSQIDNVMEGSFQITSEYTNNQNKYLQLFDMQGVEGKKSIGNWKGMDGFEYEKNEIYPYLFIGENGELSYVSSEKVLDGNTIDQTKEVKKIYLNRGDSINIQINYRDGSLNLSEEISFVKSFIKDNIDIGNCDVDVRTVYIRKDLDGYDVVSMNFVMKYQGMVLDFYSLDVGMNKDGKMMVLQTNRDILVDLHEKNHIDWIFIGGVFQSFEGKAVDKLIDLQTAIHIFEKEMASFQEIKVLEIIPMYVLKPVYNPAEEEYEAAPGNIVNVEPTYSFMIECGVDDTPTGILEGNGVAYVNVNMLTGEVHTDFEDKYFALKNRGNNELSN